MFTWYSYYQARELLSINYTSMSKVSWETIPRRQPNQVTTAWYRLYKVLSSKVLTHFYALLNRLQAGRERKNTGEPPYNLKLIFNVSLCHIFYSFGVFCEESLMYLVVVWSAKRMLLSNKWGWKGMKSLLQKQRKHELEWVSNGSKFQKELGWTFGENFSIRIDYPVMFITISKLFLNIRQEWGAIFTRQTRLKPVVWNLSHT